MATDRRRKKLIEPRLQLRLGFSLFLAAAASVLVQVFVLKRLLAEAGTSLPHDQAFFTAQVPGLLFRGATITLALLIPVSMTMGVLRMHRVVGPLYRFRVYLAQVMRGEDPGPCRTRARDDLKYLLDRVNLLTAPLRAAEVELALLAPGRPRPERWLQFKLVGTFVAIAALSVLLNLIVAGSVLWDLVVDLPNDGLAFENAVPQLVLTSFRDALILSVPLTALIGSIATRRLARELARIRLSLDAAIQGEELSATPPRSSDALNELAGLVRDVAKLQDANGASERPADDDTAQPGATLAA